MKIIRRFCSFQGIGLAIWLMIAGCGGGGSSSPQQPLQGVFIDSAVEGLQYQTSTQSGHTDSAGTFHYHPGERVVFSIGSLVIGEAVAGEQLSPMDLVPGAEDEKHPTVNNISRFLMSLDEDGDATNGICISDTVTSEVDNRSIDFMLPMKDFENQQVLQDLFVVLNTRGAFTDNGIRTLCSIEKAQLHLAGTLGFIDDGNGHIQYSAAGNIGAAGGVVAVTDLESSAYGAEAVILSDALPEEKTITIRASDLPADVPAGSSAVGESIDFGPDGTTFEKPIYISIPYIDRNNDGIIDGTTLSESASKLIYWNESSGIWEDVDVLNRNTHQNVVEAKTDHFSKYLVVIDETGQEDPVTPDVTEYLSGEYFVGAPEFRYKGEVKELIRKGCVGQNRTECAKTNSCLPCGHSYVLTITRPNLTVKAVVDRYATTNGGYKATVSADGTSVTVDASGLFEKIKNSGDAGLWTWKCDFITEHTHLSKFVVCDEEASGTLCDDAGERFMSAIEVVDKKNIKITPGIDVSDRVDNDGVPVGNNNLSIGNMIAIEFEAVYK